MLGSLTTVLLADNHPIFRAGIRCLIEDQVKYEVIGEVADGESCVVQAEMLKPDIMVVDISMPERDGLEVTRWAASNLRECRIVVLSMHSGKAFVEEARLAGAAAFVSKEDAGSELLAALEWTGGFHMSSTAGRIESETVMLAESANAARMLTGLSHKETDVLRLIARSQTSRQISEALGISVRTVHTHRQNICKKLELHGSNSLLQFALKNRDLIVEQG